MSKKGSWGNKPTGAPIAGDLQNLVGQTFTIDLRSSKTVSKQMEIMAEAMTKVLHEAMQEAVSQMIVGLHSIPASLASLGNACSTASSSLTSQQMLQDMHELMQQVDFAEKATMFDPTFAAWPDAATTKVTVAGLTFHTVGPKAWGLTLTLKWYEGSQALPFRKVTVSVSESADAKAAMDVLDELQTTREPWSFAGICELLTTIATGVDPEDVEDILDEMEDL